MVCFATYRKLGTKGLLLLLQRPLCTNHPLVRAWFALPPTESLAQRVCCCCCNVHCAQTTLWYVHGLLCHLQKAWHKGFVAAAATSTVHKPPFGTCMVCFATYRKLGTKGLLL